jgi:hypothetical protein
MEGLGMTGPDLSSVDRRKSSRSSGGASNRVEVAFVPGEVAWRKSSRSGAASGGGGSNCVEVALVPGYAAVRDSKNPQGPALVLTPGQLTAFIAAASAGVFDPR